MPHIAEKVRPISVHPGRPASDASTSAAHLAQGAASHDGRFTGLNPCRHPALGRSKSRDGSRPAHATVMPSRRSKAATLPR